MKRMILLAALFAGACRDERPPAPTEKQASELNEIDAELNAMANNEEGPADRSASPSSKSD